MPSFDALTLMLASDLGSSEHRNHSEGTSDARTDGAPAGACNEVKLVD
jgi:hypothetical protein